MLKHKIMVDNTNYKNKPINSDPGVIQNRIVKQPIKELSIEAISKASIVYSTKVSRLTGKTKKSFKESSLIMLDIDNCYEKKEKGIKGVKLNKKDGYLTLDDFMARCSLKKIEPSLVYSTFSYKETHQRYRVIFELDTVITDYEVMNNYYNTLKDYFGKACDSSIRPESLSYAGKDILHLNTANKNISNLISFLGPQTAGAFIGSSTTNGCIPTFNDCGAQTPQGFKKQKLSHAEVANTSDINVNAYKRSSKTIVQQLPYIKYLSNGCTIDSNDHTTVIARLERSFSNIFLQNVYGNKQFNSYISFKEYVKTIPLEGILEISNSKSFSCLFHEDNKPSANIYMDKYGHSYYKCFSCKRSYDIIDLVIEAYELESNNNMRMIKALNIIKNKLNIEIQNSEWYESEILLIRSNRQFLIRLKDYAEKYPKSYKKIMTNDGLLNNLLNLSEQATSILELNEINDEYGTVFSASCRYLSDKVNKSHTTILKRIDDLVLMGLIKKIPDKIVKKINPKLYMANIKLMSKQKNQTIDSYMINIWDEEMIQNAEQALIKAQLKGATKIGATKRQYNAIGIETRIKNNNKEIQSTDHLNLLLNWSDRTLKRKGYIVKADYISYAKKNSLGEAYASSFITTITTKLNLERRIATKELQSKLNFNSKTLKKAIFIKEEISGE